MKGYMIEKTDARQFKQHLESLEYAPGSIEKYVRDFLVFQRWAGHRAVGKEDLLRWKASLQAIGYRPETVNAKLAALNCFFRFKGWDDCCVKYLKIQRRLFRSTERELTKAEYLRLIETAEREKKQRLALLMETICATGIRVSEVKYITVAAVQEGLVSIALKGKIRTILIPDKLRRKLYKYAKKQKIVSEFYFAGPGLRLALQIRRGPWGGQNARN